MMTASPATAGASGASGIACDGVIANRPKPRASAEAASSFMGYSFHRFFRDAGGLPVPPDRAASFAAPP